MSEVELSSVFDRGYCQDELSDDPLEEHKEEVEKKKICCRCGSEIDPPQSVFDMDECDHAVCANCRFTDVLPCKFCSPASKKPDSVPKLNNLASLKNMFFSRSIVNKDHIVDVESTSSELKQMCTVCQRVFKRSNARYHYSCATGSRPLACDLCPHTFVKKSHLQAHINSHLGIRPFKCTERKCKKSFSQKDKLVRHMLTHITKERTFTCKTCNKKFATAASIKAHEGRVHSTEKRHQCDKCPRSYRHKESLRVHQLRHQGKRDHMCEICGKRYSLLTRLRQHRMIHRPYARRPFKCGCGKRFVSKRDRARHQMLHSTTRDFECSICKTTFGRKDNLERHMKNFHQVEPFTEKRKIVVSKSLSSSEKVAALPKLDMQPIIEPKKDLPQKKSRKMKDSRKKKSDCVRDTIKVKSNSGVVKAVPLKSGAENKTVPPIIATPVRSNENQNRPSVIKQIPKLLHYRELPPGKRFLKITEEMFKNKSVSELMPPPSSSYNTKLKLNTWNTSPLSLSSNTKHNRSKSFTLLDNDRKTISKPQAEKKKYCKDDPINRCYRIICHTNNFQNLPMKAPVKNNKRLSTEPKATGSQNDLSLSQQTFPHNIQNFEPKTSSSVIIENTPFLINLQPLTKVPLIVNDPFDSTKAGNPITVDQVMREREDLLENETFSAGPSLPASLPENPFIEEQFETPYTPLGESSCSSYIPYFESCLQDNANQFYDGNIDPLLTNDLDIGFQYINEEFTSTERSYISESRVYKYVSQETRVVREFFPQQL